MLSENHFRYEMAGHFYQRPYPLCESVKKLMSFVDFAIRPSSQKGPSQPLLDISDGRSPCTSQKLRLQPHG